MISNSSIPLLSFHRLTFFFPLLLTFFPSFKTASSDSVLIFFPEVLLRFFHNFSFFCYFPQHLLTIMYLFRSCFCYCLPTNFKLFYSSLHHSIATFSIFQFLSPNFSLLYSTNSGSLLSIFPTFSFFLTSNLFFISRE